MTKHAGLKAVVASLVLSGTALIPSVAFAGTSSSASSSSNASTSAASKATVSKSAAVALARSLFSIPSSYTLQNESFGTNYGNNTSNPVYSFTFQKSTPGQPSDNISVSIDAVTKAVISYNHYERNQSFTFPVPVSQTKAETVANQWAKKLYPTKLADTKMTAEPFQSNNLRTPVQYTFRYERIVSGIPAPFDGFSITIDQNGHLSSVNEAWHNVQFPSVTNTVSSATAEKTFLSALGLHLEYKQMWHPNSNPTTALSYTESRNDYPTGFDQQFSGNYQPTGIYIDAQNGDLLDASGNTHKPVPPISPTPLASNNTSSTSFNEKKVNWNEQQALAYAKQVVPLTGDAKLQHENEWSNAQSDTTWNFTFSENHGSDKQPTQVTVGVDATYGYLTQFNSYMPGQYNGNQLKSGSKQLSQTTLQADAVTFAKKVFAGHLGGIAIQPQPNYGGNTPRTSFQLVGMTNGIPDQSLNGNIQVDSTTGQITNMYFGQGPQESTTLPNPKQAVSVGIAQKAYENMYPMKLTYVMTNPIVEAKMQGKMPPTPSPTNPKILLAYAPTPTSQSMTSMYFDAIQGKFVATNSSNMIPYSGQINDIQGNPDAPQLTLLARRGLLPVDAKGDIHPNEALTNASFVKLLMDSLQRVNLYNTNMTASAAVAHAMSGVSKSDPGYKALTVAYSLGWLNPNQPLTPNALITRSEAAQLLANALGYDSLLTKPSLFNLSAKDASSIRQNDRAGDAISIALNMLLLSKNGNFDGSKPLSVADAAHAVVQAATLTSSEQGGPIYPLK